MGRRPDHTAEELAPLYLIAKRLKDAVGLDEMEARIGAEQSTIDRWVAGRQGMSRAYAAKLRDHYQEVFATVATAIESSAPSITGASMALTILQGRENRGLLFPTLALCVENNRRATAANRRPWSEAAIVAAAAGAAGDSDLASDEWATTLDELEAFFERIRAVSRMQREP